MMHVEANKLTRRENVFDTLQIPTDQSLNSNSQILYFNSVSFPAGLTSMIQTVYAFSKSVVAQFVSDSEGGPHFSIVYNTSTDCPSGYVIGESGTSCEVGTQSKLHLFLTAFPQYFWLFAPFGPNGGLILSLCESLS
jgi:hypothetical protein